ncbi:hypothetical protein QE152_g4085 [Popillia japonica]|uniref:Uncharacterized protein n=1 Tax=Popillia japonica TaxID=7064 RepID=A0AAW1MXW2_POPJA
MMKALIILKKKTPLRTRHTIALAKCTNLWKLESKPKTNEIIQEILGYTLSYPGATRWNSFYDAVSKILLLKDKLLELYERFNNSNIKHQKMNDSELEYLREYCLIFKPLVTVLDILKGDQNTYFGYLLLCLGSLNKKFKRLQNEKLTCHTQPISEACRQGLHRRFEKYFNFSTMECKDAVLASFTIPKFKLRWVNSFEGFEIQNLNNNVTRLVFEAGKETI